MRLSISSTSWLLGFFDTDIIDSLLDNIVVDLLLGGSKEGYIVMNHLTKTFYFPFHFIFIYFSINSMGKSCYTL